MQLEIPIFPLDNVVLFPKVQVPLYIFEPRYRQMTAAAIEGDGRIGMVTVQPSHREGMPGDPPVFEIGCMGTIGHAEAHEDGTYHIILEGSSRFRIAQEIAANEERLYRVARVDLLEDTAPSASLRGTRDRVLELVRELAPDRAEQLDAATFESLDDVTFINAFSQSLELGTLEKQQLIEANGVLTRGEQLISLLEFRVAEHGAAAPPGSGTLH